MVSPQYVIFGVLQELSFWYSQVIRMRIYVNYQKMVYLTRVYESFVTLAIDVCPMAGTSFTLDLLFRCHFFSLVMDILPNPLATLGCFNSEKGLYVSNYRAPSCFYMSKSPNPAYWPSNQITHHSLWPKSHLPPCTYHHSRPSNSNPSTLSQQ